MELDNNPATSMIFLSQEKISIKPNTSGWDCFDVRLIHVIEAPCHPQADIPTDKARTSEISSKWTASLMGTNPDKEVELKNEDLFAGQQVSSNAINQLV